MSMRGNVNTVQCVARLLNWGLLMVVNLSYLFRDKQQSFNLNPNVI